ncbi:apolipoprotein N-acyltransferase [Tritonibacter horizontis]|uniref:Apolipoprotein N-acyltransferase n=1 Tax=Tritonibacter horizontis TaxID=1768241 RepID=A0A132BRX1_9RHOB|nr:apolipoprotein N-acyltransferase [Tritonibacter horizontis]KUP91064.1 apolipoprotein N-acyltransferase [Tritonibacter horizontis]
MSLPPVLQRCGPLGLGFAAGAVMAQGLAPVAAIWAAPLALLAVSVLFLHDVRRRDKPAWAGALGWCVGTGYFAFGLSWIMEPFQIDAAAHGWMAPFALAGLAGGLALFWALAFGLAAGLGRGDGRIVMLIGCWGLAELARGYVLTGFPWAGFAQLAVPADLALRLLPWIGAPGVAVLLLIAVVPLALLRCRPVWAVAPGVVVGALAVLTPPLPAASDLDLTPQTVRLVQPNAPQNEKWLPEKRWLFVQRTLALSAGQTEAGGRPDLVVWPETALPTLQNYIADVTPDMVAALGGAELFYGIQREENGRYYNSAVVMSGEGERLDIYDKIHLVPFGEYMPLSALWDRFGVFGLAARAAGGYAPGTERRLLDTAVGRALPLICYEGVFAQDVNAAPARPDYLLLITNDAWFGSYSGPYQHLVQAQLRAAEQGLPMLRVANTGVSAVIDPYGRLRASLALNTAGALDARLPAALPPTLYSRTGDWPVLLFLLVLICVAALPRLHAKI